MSGAILWGVRVQALLTNLIDHCHTLLTAGIGIEGEVEAVKVPQLHLNMSPPEDLGDVASVDCISKHDVEGIMPGLCKPLKRNP